MKHILRPGATTVFVDTVAEPIVNEPWECIDDDVRAPVIPDKTDYITQTVGVETYEITIPMTPVPGDPLIKIINIWAYVKSLEGGAARFDVVVNTTGEPIYIDGSAIGQSWGWSKNIGAPPISIRSSDIISVYIFVDSFNAQPVWMAALYVEFGTAAVDKYTSRVRDLVFDSCPVPVISVVESAAVGTIPAEYVGIKVSSVTELGETLPCLPVEILPSGGKSLSITISRVPLASSYRIYALSANESPVNGTYKLQTEVAITQQAVQTVVLSALSVAGTDEPIEDTGTSLTYYRSYEDAINAAMVRYSQLFPRELSEEYLIEASVFEYTLPTNWDNGISSPLSVQYPIDAYPPEFLDVAEGDYFIRDGKLCFDDNVVTAGETAKLYYTAAHKVTEDNVITVPSVHFEPLCLLAASFISRQIAARYAQLSRRTIGADSADYNIKNQLALKDADEFAKQAYKLLGISEDNIPASAMAVFSYYSRHGEV